MLAVAGPGAGKGGTAPQAVGRVSSLPVDSHGGAMATRMMVLVLLPSCTACINATPLRAQSSSCFSLLRAWPCLQRNRARGLLVLRLFLSFGFGLVFDVVAC